MKWVNIPSQKKKKPQHSGKKDKKKEEMIEKGRRRTRKRKRRAQEAREKDSLKMERDGFEQKAERLMVRGKKRERE